METDEMKKCPYCAELIKKEAVKCRYCGSSLVGKGFWQSSSSGPQFWRRVNEGKKVAGVCTGVARQLEAPILILPLRLFFVLTTLFYGFGLILYIVLWILMPSPINKLEQEKSAFAGQQPPSPPVDSCSSPTESSHHSVESESPAVKSGLEVKPKKEIPLSSESGTGAAPEDMNEGPQQMKGLLLFLGVAAIFFLVYLIFSGWGWFSHPVMGKNSFGCPSGGLLRFPLIHGAGFSYTEWIKLLIVGGVVLVILAGANIISLGIIPLVFVAVGSFVFLRWMHFVSFPGITATVCIGAILFAVFWITRRMSVSASRKPLGPLSPK